MDNKIEREVMDVIANKEREYEKLCNEIACYKRHIKELDKEIRQNTFKIIALLIYLACCLWCLWYYSNLLVKLVLK